MGVMELLEMYLSQENKANKVNCGGHMDIGPGHFDYPHQDGHTDES